MTVNVNTGVVDPALRLSNEIREGTSDVLSLMDLDATPFLGILRSLPSESAYQTQVVWNVQQNRPLFAVLAATAASADTSLTLDTNQGAYVQAGDLVVLFAGGGGGELCAVTGVTSDTIGVTRSVGGVAAATAQTGSQVMILGPKHAQGADVVTPLWVSAQSGYNYTEIFRHLVQLTGTAANAGRYGGNGNKRDVAFALAQHARQIEQTLFFGGRSYDTSGSHPVGTMGGLVEFVPETAIDAALTAALFGNAIEQAMAIGTKKKVIFAGSRAARGDRKSVV